MGAAYTLPTAQRVESSITLPSCHECHPELYGSKGNLPQESELVSDAQDDVGVWGRCPGVSGKIPSGFAEALMGAVDHGNVLHAEKLLQDHSEWLQGPLAFGGDAACLHVLQVLLQRREPQQLGLLKKILVQNFLVDQLWPTANCRGVETEDAGGVVAGSKLAKWGFRQLALRPSAVKGQLPSAVPPPAEWWATRTAARLLRGVRSSQRVNINCSEQQKETLKRLREQPLLSVGEVAILYTQDERVHKVVAEATQKPSVLLIAAVANSTAGVVHTLLQRGANPVSIRHGFSPLNLSAGAALSPFEKSFLLLSHGSPPEPPLPSDAADKIVSDKAANAAARFALGWASKRKGPRLHDDVFFPSKEAIEESAATLGPPVFVQQSSDAPALLQATARGDIKLMRLLLEHGASPNVFVSGVGLPTPLFHAVYWGLKAPVRLLLAYGANPFLCKENGESVEDTARRMLDFSLLSKPKHIAKLPLPKSHPEACKYILGLIENAQRRWARAAVSAAVEMEPFRGLGTPQSGNPFFSGLVAERGPLFRTSWESLVIEPARNASNERGSATRGSSNRSSTSCSEISDCGLDRLPSVDLKAFLHTAVPLLEHNLKCEQVTLQADGSNKPLELMNSAPIRRLPSVSDLFDGLSCGAHSLSTCEARVLKESTVCSASLFPNTQELVDSTCLFRKE